MSTTNTLMHVSNIPIHITRKDIKRLHLSVYPPDGQVRVSAPEYMTEDNIRLAVVSRLKWIRTQQKQFQDQPRQTERRMVSGESHFLWGARYCLSVTYQQGKHEIQPKNEYLLMTVSPDTSTENRERLLMAYYRHQLKLHIPPLLKKWQPIINRTVTDWGVRRMKTKWGSCTPEAGRIWLNLELAKKPLECLEYVLIHEMVHLLEANHGDVFVGYMNKYFPNWRRAKKLLNGEILAHEEWS